MAQGNRRADRLRARSVVARRHARERYQRIKDDPGRAARRVVRRTQLALARARGVPLLTPAQQAERDRATREPALAAPEALRVNGFVVFRGLISGAECTALAARLKDAAGVEHGAHFTRTDATNKVPAARDVLFDERVLGAVRAGLGEQVRFLQTSDLHYRHDTPGWHRDSVHRATDNTDSPDWADGEFAVVKAILYLESSNAGLGVMAGSHASPIAIDHDFVRIAEKRGEHFVVGPDDEPNRRYTEAERRLPLVWQAQPGDLLVFDERLYHAGRRVEDGRVIAGRQGEKLTLSLVFGRDNVHSERMYSYFRYARREIGYRPFDTGFERELASRDLLLTSGQRNHYVRHPEELRLASLRDPAKLEALIAEFAAAGGTGDR